MKSSEIQYYENVSTYYDGEAGRFEQNYENNVILQRIRHDFREHTEKYAFQTALEIGCGPGIDLSYFCQKYPERDFWGIDISSEMVNLSRQKFERAGRDSDRVLLGSLDTLISQLPDSFQFDMIYCYYGALNTVMDLKKVANTLHKVIAPNGIMVLTFISKWYWFDIVWNLLRLRPKRSFSRLCGKWPGYSPGNPLQSYPRSYHDVQQAFMGKFSFIGRKGYSITFPAWYRSRFLNTTGPLGDFLWRFDLKLNHTFLWNLGEYSLYILKPEQR